MLALSYLLDVSVSDFFMGLETSNRPNTTTAPLFDKTTRELVSLFNLLESPKTKKAIIDLLKSKIHVQQTEASNE